MTPDPPKQKQKQRQQIAPPPPQLEADSQLQHQQLPQEFKDRLEALFSQCKSCHDNNKQDLDTLEKHHRDLYEDHLATLARLKSNLQLALSDTKIMRVHISTFDGRVDELRALIERNRQMSTTQTEVLALLRQERHARVASQTDLEERTRRLEVDLAAMSRRLDTLSRRFIRQKESNANNKDDEQQRLRANIAAEKEKQNRIKDVTQHILDSIKCFEAEQTPTWSKPNTVSELEHSRPLYVKEKADPVPSATFQSTTTSAEETAAPSTPTTPSPHNTPHLPAVELLLSPQVPQMEELKLTLVLSPTLELPTCPPLSLNRCLLPPIHTPNLTPQSPSLLRQRLRQQQQKGQQEQQTLLESAQSHYFHRVATRFPQLGQVVNNVLVLIALSTLLLLAIQILALFQYDQPSDAFVFDPGFKSNYEQDRAMVDEAYFLGLNQFVGSWLARLVWSSEAEDEHGGTGFIPT